MGSIEVAEQCLTFIDQGERVANKFLKLVELMGALKIVHSNFVKKLTNTCFYELRIKA